MVKFVYVGGQTPSERVQFEYREDPKGPYRVLVDDQGRPVEDERGEHAPEAPDKVQAFGLWFRKGEVVDVTPNRFPDPAKHQHAVLKLRTNRFFEEVKIEDAKVEEVAGEPEVAAERPRRRKAGAAE